MKRYTGQTSEQADKVEQRQHVAVVLDGNVQSEDFFEYAGYAKRQAGGVAEQQILGHFHKEGEEGADEDVFANALGDDAQAVLVDKQALEPDGQRKKTDDHPRGDVIHHLDWITQPCDEDS